MHTTTQKRPMLQPRVRKNDSWKHQLEAYHFAETNGSVMLAMEMGTGKSKVAIDLIANQYSQYILILCPKAVGGVWVREFERHYPYPVKVLNLCEAGTVEKKAIEAKRALSPSHMQQPLTVIVCNYDIAWRPALAAVLTKVVWNMVVCDESHRIKSHSGKASRFCAAVGRNAQRRICLTGTPMPHSPLDLYGQYRFLDPEIFGSSFTRFRGRYAICHPQYHGKVMKHINQDELQDKFMSRAFVCWAREVLDLPETMDQVIDIELAPSTMRVYRELEHELVAEIDAGTVTIPSAMVKLLRLQQVTSGYVGFVDDFGDRVTAELSDEKESALEDLIGDLDEKVVVFCRFRHDLDAVERVAERLGRTYCELSGRRRELTSHAEMLPHCQVMGVQIQSGGVGIDLTAAHHAVYFSMGYSLGDYLQSRARLHRPGQRHCVRFYHLVAKGTVDTKVYRALELRQEVVENILHKMEHQ